MAEIPPELRPRQRLRACGAEALAARELLALLLRSGTRGMSVLDVADRLLCEFQGVAGLATARPEELTRVRGVGPASAAIVVAAFQLHRAAAIPRGGRIPLRSHEDAARIAQPRLAGLRRERLLALVGNRGGWLRHVEMITLGSVDRVPVPVREVLNCVLRHNGTRFALVHNHPSGDSSPSAADFQAASGIAAAAEVLGVQFIGHVVVSDSTWHAVAEGALPCPVEELTAVPAWERTLTPAARVAADSPAFSTRRGANVVPVRSTGSAGSAGTYLYGTGQQPPLRSDVVPDSPPRDHA